VPEGAIGLVVYGNQEKKAPKQVWGMAGFLFEKCA
jgi:hypothetical protein